MKYNFELQIKESPLTIATSKRVLFLFGDMIKKIGQFKITKGKNEQKISIDTDDYKGEIIAPDDCDFLDGVVVSKSHIQSIILFYDYYISQYVSYGKNDTPGIYQVRTFTNPDTDQENTSLYYYDREVVEYLRNLGNICDLIKSKTPISTLLQKEGITPDYEILVPRASQKEYFYLPEDFSTTFDLYKQIAEKDINSSDENRLILRQ